VPIPLQSSDSPASRRAQVSGVSSAAPTAMTSTSCSPLPAAAASASAESGCCWSVGSAAVVACVAEPFLRLVRPALPAIIAMQYSTIGYCTINKLHITVLILGWDHSFHIRQSGTVMHAPM
jgi:hypothetical protein